MVRVDEPLELSRLVGVRLPRRRGGAAETRGASRIPDAGATCVLFCERKDDANDCHSPAHHQMSSL